MTDDPRQPTYILDPSGLYPVGDGYHLVSTEVEWLQQVGVRGDRLWIRGKFLCDWTQTWLNAWNRQAESQVLQSPRDRLQTLLTPLPIPEDWTQQHCLHLADHLNRYPHNPLAAVLAEVSHSHPDFWLANPSHDHLATWLTLTVPPDYAILEEAWRYRRRSHPLGDHYQTPDKLQLLRQWLGLLPPAIPELGSYPGDIPPIIAEEFDKHWKQQLDDSQGAILDQISPSQQPGFPRIAQLSYSLAVQDRHGEYFTEERSQKLKPHLSLDQYQKLQRPTPPQPLPKDATPDQALTWATQQYLPFRRWETTDSKTVPQDRISDRLAISFVDWIHHHYPQLKAIPAKDSHLNYKATQVVQDLCKTHPVLWVVVDGLGWLDQQALIGYLQDKDLAVEQLQPRFSLLPTTTEFAKWGLYAQQTPRAEVWEANMNKAFAKVGLGKRYTDSQDSQLKQDLEQDRQRLYCWDTTQLDKLYHEKKDWEMLYHSDRPSVLQRICDRIDFYLNKHPDRDRLKIVISSDHGQLLGLSSQGVICPPNLTPQGRTAKGVTDNPNFVVLHRHDFDLPEDLSIVKDASTLSSFSYSQDQTVIGSHGGLFPEEVVIGYAVLSRQVQRSPIRLHCSGSGEANQSGQLQLSIHNPNPVPLTDLILTISQLGEFQTGQPLKQTIPPNSHQQLSLPISTCPQLPPNSSQSLPLSGTLTFQYAGVEPGTADLNPEATLEIKQLFSSNLNLDEFF
ncbi:MAG: hypothetical protein EYR95_11965 [Phormidium sp. SL48-SHIP]|nr:MAG: hypothetical protein EYR95_11965 [Phormidium sp. SL48-SHIP]